MPTENRPQSPDHEKFDGQVTGYVLSALDRADQEAFERHVDDCDICTLRVREMSLVTDGLALSLEDRRLPLGLREKVLAGVSSVEAASDTDASERGSSSRTW